MIERTIHRIWLGSPLPEWAEVIYASWTEWHTPPEWRHQLWTEDNLPPLANQALYDAAEEVVAARTPGSIWQFRSDLVRYEILNRYGGLYVDCDLEMLKPMGHKLMGDFLIAWEIQGQALGNTIIGSCMAHPFIQAIIKGLPRNVEQHAGQTPTVLSGPRYITRVWHETRPTFPVQTSHLFYPYGHGDAHRHRRTGLEALKYPDAYTCHYWMNARAKKGALL